MTAPAPLQDAAVATKARKLAQINAAMDALCDLAIKKTATTVVPGEGNPDADILFIGEAPGAQEDRTGRPFVGAAGKLLDRLLASVHLRREDVFITNVVKYRPPHNRDPKPEEVAACWPWLQAQITTIQPRLIILLGRHALGRFLPGRTITADHGRAFRRTIAGCGTFVFFPIYHPAAALYNRALEEVLLHDFAKIPVLLRKIAAAPKRAPKH